MPASRARTITARPASRGMRSKVRHEPSARRDTSNPDDPSRRASIPPRLGSRSETVRGRTGGTMTATSTAPAPAGLHVYFVGHSFHMFIVRPLIYLAREAGVEGHWAEGWDMIGGSTPLQHWEQGGDDNEVKQALRSGKVEVLTLASNVIVPDPAIALFADLAVHHNPDVRVMVQHSWGDASTGAIMRARHGLTAEPAPATVPTNEDRDLATADDLARMRDSTEE